MTFQISKNLLNSDIVVVLKPAANTYVTSTYRMQK